MEKKERKKKKKKNYKNVKHNTFYQHEKLSERLRKGIIKNKVTAALTQRCIQVSRGEGGGGDASKYHYNVAFTRLEQLANKDDKKVAIRWL